jgi:hypothetical protein
MLDIIDIKTIGLDVLSMMDNNFPVNQNSTLNNLSYNENDFIAISENLRFLKRKRFIDEENEVLSNIEFDIDKKVLSNAFNDELNMTLKLMVNNECYSSIANDDIYYIKTLNILETKDLQNDTINKETVKALFNEMVKREKNEENNKKMKNYFDVKTINERGRKRIKIIEGKNKLKKHRKTDLDNILTKVQVDYIKFIINITNDILTKVSGEKKKFLDIEYSIKKKINFKNFENLKKLKVKDILQLPASKKFRSLTEKENHNKMLLNEVINSSEYLTELLNMNYLSLFKLYFNDCEPLKKINLKGIDFDLSDKAKSFYYLVKKNNFNVSEKKSFIESTKNAYFRGDNDMTQKKSFLVKKSK